MLWLQTQEGLRIAQFVIIRREGFERGSLVAEHSGHSVFGAGFAIAPSDTDKECIFLALRPRTGRGVQSLQDIGYHDLQKFRRHVAGRFGAEHSPGSRPRSVGNKAMPINSFAFAREKQIARFEHPAIVMGLGKNLVRIDLCGRYKTKIAGIPHQYIIQRKHRAVLLLFNQPVLAFGQLYHDGNKTFC